MTRLSATLVASCLLGSATAAELPWASEYKHLGAATCAGSSCHGATRPLADSAVRQDEYLLWETKDAHSNAFKLLLTPAGKRIADNLGLKAAQEAPACLTCHTDFVPEERRALRYQVTDGVGCEGCHGGAEEWNRLHVQSGATHAANLAAGMYPLDDPAARARLCLNCHLGSAAKPIDHRMMGAGHPPLSFELDTFTAIQPAHFVPDADYRQRKGYAGNLKTWAVGQTVAAEFVLEGLSGARFRIDGWLPELAFFDCNACHHATRPVRWNSAVAPELGPGNLRIADAGFVMAGHVIATVLPARAAEWDGALRELHAASRTSIVQVKEVAGRMRKIAGEATAAASKASYGRGEALALLGRIVATGEGKAAGDCTAAEQAVYLVGVVGEALREIEGSPVKGYAPAYERAVESVNCRSGAFNQEEFRGSLRKIREIAESLNRS